MRFTVLVGAYVAYCKYYALFYLFILISREGRRDVIFPLKDQCKHRTGRKHLFATFSSAFIFVFLIAHLGGYYVHYGCVFVCVCVLVCIFLCLVKIRMKARDETNVKNE